MVRVDGETSPQISRARQEALQGFPLQLEVLRRGELYGEASDGDGGLALVLLHEPEAEVVGGVGVGIEFCRRRGANVLAFRLYYWRRLAVEEAVGREAIPLFRILVRSVRPARGEMRDGADFFLGRRRVLGGFVLF